MSRVRQKLDEEAKSGFRQHDHLFSLAHGEEERYHRERRRELVTRLREPLRKNSPSDLFRNSSLRAYLRVQGTAITIDETTKGGICESTRPPAECPLDCVVGTCGSPSGRAILPDDPAHHQKEVPRLQTRTVRGKEETTRVPAPPFAPNAWAGLILTPARWIAGFMFLSAFIRRVISQPVKLDPAAKEYVGHSFAHFLPHSIVITPFINYLVQHPHVLYPFMVLFTTLEGLVGLLLILGLLTRLSSVGSGLLSLGILLGSGWLGSTCVDEWQIGALLVGLAGVVALSGGGPISLDALLVKRWPSLQSKGWFRLVFSGDNPERTDGRGLRTSVIVTGIVTAFIMLATYQAFHNGLWGKLYNDSKLPQVTISGQSVATDGALHLTLYRSGGPDTYGAFIVAIKVLEQGKPVEVYTPKQLSALPKTAIKNELMLAQAKVNHFSIILPLAAKAAISLPPAAPNLALNAGQKLTVIVYDVSGQKWSAPVLVR